MATEKKTAPEVGAEGYEAWKAELSSKGKTPAEAVAFCRSVGLKDYADDLQEVIDEMEDCS